MIDKQRACAATGTADEELPSQTKPSDTIFVPAAVAS